MTTENEIKPAAPVEALDGGRCALAICSAAFERWWHDEGSGFPPLAGEDRETHMHRVAEIAWSNGAYLERNAIVGVVHTLAIVRGQKSLIDELGAALRALWKAETASIAAFDFVQVRALEKAMAEAERVLSFLPPNVQ